MTLVVSARVPDGIVVGADSLATLAVQGQPIIRSTVQCPHCGKEHEVELPVQLPPGMGTISTLPYALKLIPIRGRYALAAFGSSLIGNKTIFSLIMAYQRDNKENVLPEYAQSLGRWLHEQLAHTIDVAGLPEDASALGFQLSGYDQGQPKTVTVNIGRTVSSVENVDLGVTVSGETSAVAKMWELGQTYQQMRSAYQAWSVLDAADYVRFLISFTADVQRFGMMVPNVGGDIDLALVTQDRFTWIQKKPLADLLLGGADSDERQ